MGLDLSKLFRLDLGKPLGGRYKIIEQLGAGGFSQTFLADDLHLPGHPRCVVKQLKPQVSDTAILQTARRLFDTEAQVLYKLGNHDQIPHLFAHFEDNREFYLVLELVEGNALTQELFPGRPWPEASVVSLLQDVLVALAFVHQQNVIHRDIKPSNLIRRQRDAKIVLIDFGAVKQTTAQIANPDTGPTITISIGTQGYMPNEQLAGNPRFNSDIFALGMIAIQALTGIHPRDIHPDPHTGELDWHGYVKQINPDLVAILDRMVRYHFKDRYQTADEALGAISDLLAKHPDLAKIVETATRLHEAEAEAEAQTTEPETYQTITSLESNYIPETISSSSTGWGSSFSSGRRSRLWQLIAGVGTITVAAIATLPSIINTVSQSVAVPSTVPSTVLSSPCANAAIDPLLTQTPDYEYPNGTKYYGSLQNGLPSTGNVTMLFPNGNRYDGSLVNGKRTGCGTLSFANGRRYTGEFSDDKFSGQGIWTLENGDRYVGEFKDNRCHGEGTFIFADGTSKHGRWQDGSLIGENLSCDR
ncbi:protein kinase [Oculatella sp. LEGE 06141]|uniref:protein kinase domain-containing protein n=1 Tax=Oculatella sp. LEGE 06141 TaxID=1828648 RepID=UPI00187FD989|nr:protein kinase [Oculatella sp. LEGE 06141]MBE9182923.1 protein kinase [Oculatella sp. LEGE 06141]